MNEYIKRIVITTRYVIWKIQKVLMQMFLPGFRGQSLYDVGVKFFKGVWQGFVADRAAAVAFNFFTALFPLLLFAFTLIPYIPIPEFQNNLLDTIHDLLPEAIWQILDTSITYIITEKDRSLLSVGVLMSLYLGSNGIDSLLRSFSMTYHNNFKKYSGLQRRLISILILLIFCILITLAMGVRVATSYLATLINTDLVNISNVATFFIKLVSWVLTIFILLLAILFLYRLAIKQKRGFPFFSIGGYICTGLIILTTYLFQIYIENFAMYNVLYGSLGTVLILTLYLYLNSLFLIVGFDINASIYAAVVEAKKDVIKLPSGHQT